MSIFNRKRTVTILLFVFFSFLPNCSSDESGCLVCPTIPEVKTVSVSATEIGPVYVPNRPTTGDADFEGHGPSVTFQGSVYALGDSIMWSLYVYANEGEPDWTRGYITKTELFYVAPDGWTITAIDTPLTCNAQYRDTNHEMDFIDCGDIKFRGYGDCPGDDVGVCTRYWMWFRELEVELTKK